MSSIHYTSPDGTQELLAKSSLARGKLIDAWRKSELDAHRGEDYRKLVTVEFAMAPTGEGESLSRNPIFNREEP